MKAKGTTLFAASASQKGAPQKMFDNADAQAAKKQLKDFSDDILVKGWTTRYSSGSDFFKQLSSILTAPIAGLFLTGILAVGTALALAAAAVSLVVSAVSALFFQFDFAKNAAMFAAGAAVIGAVGTFLTGLSAVMTAVSGPLNAVKTVTRGVSTLFTPKEESETVDSDAYDKAYNDAPYPSPVSS